MISVLSFGYLYRSSICHNPDLKWNIVHQCTNPGESHQHPHHTRAFLPSPEREEGGFRGKKNRGRNPGNQKVHIDRFERRCRGNHGFYKNILKWLFSVMSWFKSLMVTYWKRSQQNPENTRWNAAQGWKIYSKAWPRQNRRRRISKSGRLVAFESFVEMASWTWRIVKCNIIQNVFHTKNKENDNGISRVWKVIVSGVEGIRADHCGKRGWWW